MEKKIKCTSCGMIYDVSDDDGFITNCYLGCGSGDIVFDIEVEEIED